MRKILRKSFVVITAIVMFLSLCLGIFLKIDWNCFFVKADYSAEYTSLSNKDLDTLTYRTAKSNKSPQITVFTHGFNGAPSHWSNDGNGNFVYNENIPGGII